MPAELLVVLMQEVSKKEDILHETILNQALQHPWEILEYTWKAGRE